MAARMTTSTAVKSQVLLSSPQSRGASICKGSTCAKDDEMSANHVPRWTSSGVVVTVLLSATTALGQSGTRDGYSAPSRNFSTPPSSQPLGSSSRFTRPPTMPQPSQSISPPPFQSYAPPAQTFSAPSQFGGVCSSMTARLVLGLPTVTRVPPPATVQAFRPVQVQSFGSPPMSFVQPAQSFSGVRVQTFRPVAPTPVRVFRPFGFRPAYVVPVYGGY